MPAQGGRPPKLTPDVQQRLVDAIQAANTYVAACAHAGISYSVFAKWMRQGRAAKSGKFVKFVQAVRAAEARAELSLATQLRQLVADDWRGTLALLGRRFPRRWADRRKSEVELTGKRGGPIEIVGPIQEALANDDTRELLARLTERLCVLPAAHQPGDAGSPGHVGPLAAAQAPEPAQPQTHGGGGGPD